MLASMVTARRPTRAEVTDVANAIYDGTDAIMLSEETAVGENPVEAVRVMDRIARATEPDLRYGEWLFSRTDQATQDVADSVAQSAVGAVYRLGLKALVVPTTSGRTARILSAHRPNVPVLAISPRLETVRRLSLLFGVTAVQAEHDDDIRGAARRLRRARRQARRRPLRRADRDHRRAARPGTGDEPLRGPPGPLSRAAVGCAATDRLRGDRAGNGQAVPFAAFLGLEFTRSARARRSCGLPERPELTNHVGSQHAGALFTAAEAASGGAFVGAFAERLGEVTPLARSAEISYEKIAKGPIDATAKLGVAAADALAALDAEGKVVFPCQIELEGRRWHPRRDRQRRLACAAEQARHLSSTATLEWGRVLS